MSEEPAAGLDPSRAVQVIARRHGRSAVVGSGYVVAEDLVLSAAHVVHAAAQVVVRLVTGPGLIRELEAHVEFADEAVDVAVLRLARDLADSSAPGHGVPPVRFGLVAGIVACEALGFPRFKLRQSGATDPSAPGTASTSTYRDSHHAAGTAAAGSNLRGGTLEITVAPPEYDPDPDHSPWEGMSGAAVFSGDCLIGVVAEHHRGDGLGRLAASRIEFWHNRLSPDAVRRLGTLIGLPADVSALIPVSNRTAIVARPFLMPPLGDQPGLDSISAPVGQLPAVIRGRDELLDELTAALTRHGPDVYVLHGIGGCGKTTVALEVARRAQGLTSPVWWISAASAATLSAGMRQLALALGADDEQVRLAWSGQASASDLVWNLLVGRTDAWLLVVDNADDSAILAPARGRVASGTGWIRRPPTASRGTVLVTRRGKDPRLWGTWAQLRLVDRLTAESGGQLLLDLVGTRAGSSSDAEALAADLQGLPLALRLAGSYLHEAVTQPAWPRSHPVRSFAGYQQLLRSRITLLDTTPPGQYDDRTQQELITRTWEISLDLLHSQGKDQPRPLLRLLAHLADAPVPYTLLLDPAILSSHRLVGPITYEQIFRALTSLADLALIDLVARQGPDPDNPLAYTLSLHPLVRATNREHPDVVAKRAGYLKILGSSLRRATEDLDPDEPGAWPTWQLLAPHASSLLAMLAASVDIDRETARLVVNAAQGSADYLEALGMYERAEAEYTAVIDFQRLLLGDEHPDTLTTRHNLAYTLRDRGSLDRAEAEFRQVLASRERILGEQHPKTLITRNQLARVYRDQGRYADAEDEFRNVLKAQRAAQGDDDPDTLVTRSNLASMYFADGRLEEAEAEYRIVLASDCRILGEDHVESLVTRGNLAKVLAERGKHGEAEAEYRAVLGAEQRVLGTDHPDTLTTRHNLAGVLAAQGRRAEATTEYRAVLSARRRLLGDQHPNTRQTEAALVELAPQMPIDDADVSSLYRCEGGVLSL